MPSDATMTHISNLDTRRLPPDPEGTGTQQAMVRGSQEVATDTKQMQHDALHRQESLRVRGRCEPAHLSLAVPRRLMRDLGPVISYWRVLCTTDGITVRCAAA